MGRLAAAVVLSAAITAADSPAQVLYYQDADGVIHFTNRPTPGYGAFEGRDVAAPAGIRSASRRVPSGRGSGEYDDLIAEYSALYDVDPALVKAMIRAESGFNRLAVSHKGARGLMQLMPATAKRHGVVNSFSPRDNIRGGTEHLRTLLDRYRGNVTWAVAAYNAGAGAVDRYRGIPPYRETRTYVSRVLRYRRDYLRDMRLAAR